MLSPKLFFEHLLEQEIDFFSGIPDSVLKSFCAYIIDHTSKGNHIICANEGAAIGLAIGTTYIADWLSDKLKAR